MTAKCPCTRQSGLWPHRALLYGLCQPRSSERVSTRGPWLALRSRSIAAGHGRQPRRPVHWLVRIRIASRPLRSRRRDRQEGAWVERVPVSCCPGAKTGLTRASLRVFLFRSILCDLCAVARVSFPWLRTGPLARVGFPPGFATMAVPRHAGSASVSRAIIHRTGVPAQAITDVCPHAPFVSRGDRGPDFRTGPPRCETH